MIKTGLDSEGSHTKLQSTKCAQNLSLSCKTDSFLFRTKTNYFRLSGY